MVLRKCTLLTPLSPPHPPTPSLELLESCALISALLLEVPQMAANPLNVKRRMVSKSFHRILDTYSKQTFTGEGTSCVVVCAHVCLCVRAARVCLHGSTRTLQGPATAPALMSPGLWPRRITALPV